MGMVVGSFILGGQSSRDLSDGKEPAMGRPRVEHMRQRELQVRGSVGGAIALPWACGGEEMCEAGTRYQVLMDSWQSPALGFVLTPCSPLSSTSALSRSS